MKVLVLGGRGFVRRHVVAALREAGRDVVIGSRDPARPPSTRLEVRRARFERLVDVAAWAPSSAASREPWASSGRHPGSSACRQRADAQSRPGAPSGK